MAQAFLPVLTLVLLSSLAYPDTLIRNVTIVDVATNSTHPKRSILIRGDKIAAIAAQLPASKSVQIVDGAGKYVIPGLWDMSVHLRDREQLEQFPAYGITNVRDMGSDFHRVKEWRAEIKSGKLLGPGVKTCGPAIDGFPSEFPWLPVKLIRSPMDARSAFDTLDDQNVDFFGILPRLPRDAYFALIERARKWYSSVAGDVPATVSAFEAIDARQRSIDHMSGILLACSSEERRLREPRSLALERNDREGFDFAEAVALQTFNQQKADTLLERMARFETRAVPTLVKLHAQPGEKDIYPKLTQLLVRMQRAGVAILSGSDSEKSESLHEELELMVAAGLTPAEALRSATLEPARFFDSTDTMGAIDKGKTADLVLLDADPLADIRNTRKIAAVFVAGKYLPKARLTTIRAQVKRAN
ncbi:MAG TPA: amidohydrolase family protein [Bryobacteraceae bacterium]|nr:amidohydrolase family protein [Bryobacteraceae bacterium]